AEDGIRDRNVTGVQTCALPISTCLFEKVVGREWFAQATEPNGYIVGQRTNPTNNLLEIFQVRRGLPVGFAALGPVSDRDTVRAEIGRASCRERRERELGDR